MRLHGFRAIIAGMMLLIQGLAGQIPLLAPPPASPPVSNGRISGVVRRAGTGEPIAEARVDLWGSVSNVEEDRGDELDNNDRAHLWFSESASVIRVSLSLPLAPARRHERGPQPFRRVKTDRSGRFEFTDLPKNLHVDRLSVFRDGYVSRDICVQGTWHCEEALKAIQTLDSVIVDLVSDGSLRGVVGEAGRSPLPLVPVELLRVVYETDGRRTLTSVASTETNDRGEYRFYHVEPGQYYVAAGTPPGQAQNGSEEAARINGIGPNRAIYMRQYYPGEVDFNRAAAVKILPDAELGDVNFWLVRQALHAVRGHVVDLTTGKLPERADIVLKPAGLPEKSGVSPAIDLAKAQYNATDGAFELRGILPGTYTLIATPGDVGTCSGCAKPVSAIATDTAAYARIQIGDNDLDDVTLALAPGASIPGRVTIIGQEIGAKLPLSPFTRIQLFPVLDGDIVSIRNLPEATISDIHHTVSGTSRVQPDGGFQLEDIRPGQYRLVVGMLPNGYYVKEVRFGGAEAYEQPMTIAGPSAGPLNIVIGFTAASVAGQVVNDRTAPVPHVLVVLVPDRLRGQPDRVLKATTRDDGRFTMDAVPPDDYRAFVWEGLPPDAYYNAEFLQQTEGYGTPIHVTEGANPALVLRAVPR